MDSIHYCTRQLLLPDGTALTLEYRLLRELLETKDGEPVCENYGLLIRQSDGAAYACANVTTDDRLAEKFIRQMADGLVDAHEAGDVLEELLGREYSLE